ncbi:hypothetical protein [Paenibacillus protaetiae]|uniref:Uncharacterized protein n=1 Tax=Paenibacillus protaetiae TaxID=2509456 RepID=A0A4P6ETZ4_9BACL|nr:hypothetical protein [Paenibacillus protaetiae]QAY65935.1 hypothetical protein ET464_05580 [Paenibacillus protaetiae]
MLTFDQKLEIALSFPELSRSDVSMGRVNFQFDGSAYDRKNVIYHLHKNGNGYVYAGLLSGYETDDKGLVNIRDYSAEELRLIIEASIRSLSEAPETAAPSARSARKTNKKARLQLWANKDGQTLQLKHEDELWFIYAGLNLDMVFESFEEAEQYLLEEGFSIAPEPPEHS